ncbi:VOC family protein [Ureibacillus sinduriensis]|uniref:Glyoxalase n=1 Tax=Ureibacillus sinduriensis BLB-1 = JCM 15800 TaxID=1384057 RepID=A0A0A3HWY6_9BACL|nr:VOC family protein [Ureibacillus sinduriensis]KGR75730.1 glyoxalase [Ureibacillus sinduriensis BLB-1 = JCM 15800]
MPTHFHKKPNMYVSHVQLKVSNLDRSIHYYESIIGFNVLERTKSSAVLTFDGTSSLLSLEEVPNAQPLRRGQTGLYHFALLLPTRSDLGNFIQHTIQQNVRVGAGDHHVSEAFYLNDPDGNGIEVYTDRPEQEWLWQEDGMVYMTTEQVNVQSILRDANGTWNGLPNGTVMGHIHLSVADLAESEKFYTEALGYEIVTRYGNQALFISTGKYHHHIGLNTWESLDGTPVPENGVGLKSFTIVLDNETQANKIKDNLSSMGAKLEPFDGAPKFSGAQAFSTVDPSGIRIVFTFDGE